MIYGFFFLTFIFAVIFFFKSYKLGFYYFLAAYFIYPRAFALGLGSSGFALTMNRAILCLMACFTLIRILISRKDRRHLSGTIGKYFFFYSLPILLWITEVVSTIVTAAPGQQTDT